MTHYGCSQAIWNVWLHFLAVPMITWFVIGLVIGYVVSVLRFRRATRKLRQQNAN